MNEENKIRLSLPNVLTAMNLISGYVALHYAMNNDYVLAFYFVLLAAIFDFLDGFAARLLHLKSGFGEILDSLCDLFSFGVVPSVVCYRIIEQGIMEAQISQSVFTNFLPLISGLIALFSALRLAKFHIKAQHEHFLGLPTPANAILICSLAASYALGEIPFFDKIIDLKIIIPVILVLSFLMVSNIPMINLKFKNFSIKKNITRYVFLMFAIVLVIIFKMNSFSLIIMGYILFSVVFFFASIKG